MVTPQSQNVRSHQTV